MVIPHNLCAGKAPDENQLIGPKLDITTQAWSVGRDIQYVRRDRRNISVVHTCLASQFHRTDRF